MKKRVIHTDKAPRPIGPYSQAIQAGSFTFVSGQIPIDPATGDLVGGDVRQQTRRVLDNMGLRGSEWVKLYLLEHAS